MFMVDRFWLKYGHEDDEMCCTTKCFDSADKAIAYAHRYAKGLRFSNAVVKDESDNIIYEICDYGANVFDYRKE